MQWFGHLIVVQPNQIKRFFEDRQPSEEYLTLMRICIGVIRPLHWSLYSNDAVVQRLHMPAMFISQGASLTLVPREEKHVKAVDRLAQTCPSSVLFSARAEHDRPTQPKPGCGERLRTGHRGMTKGDNGTWSILYVVLGLHACAY